MIDRHDKPGGAFESLRSAHQCSIRFDHAYSTIIIQGMQERDVVTAGRKFEGIAVQMITEMSQLIKISLMSPPSTPLHQSVVSMDQNIDLKSNLYYLSIPQAGKKDTFTVRTPKLWTLEQPLNEVERSRSDRMVRRLGRFNRKTILTGLEKSLTNLHFGQKAVRMQVDFGELAFLRYLAPSSGSQHHSFDDFRKTIAKDRTDLLLQAYVSSPDNRSYPQFRQLISTSMRPDVDFAKIIDHLLKHPALKSDEETSASVTETYVVAFDFLQSDRRAIVRHEQEFGASYRNDEMEMRRRSWVLMGANSERKSPLILSMLDFEKWVDHYPT